MILQPKKKGKKLKNSDIKTSERPKNILKNQMIHCLEIIETQQYIDIYIYLCVCVCVCVTIQQRNIR